MINGAIVNNNSQMADFVSSNDDTGETTGVFNDGNAVNLFEPLVDDASSSNISESLKKKILI